MPAEIHLRRDISPGTAEGRNRFRLCWLLMFTCYCCLHVTAPCFKAYANTSQLILHPPCEMMSSNSRTFLRRGSSVVLFVALLSVLIGSASARRKKGPLLRDGLYEKSRFRRVRLFSDEFNGKFDHDKWYNYNPRWRGRQPGLFVPENVRQKKGRLLMFGRYETDEEVFKDAPEGYEKYTTSFVQSKKKAKYGYFEVKAKPSNSRLSSSFWGSLDTPETWTEIDVFEMGGGAINDDGLDFRKRINMNLHVFRDKKTGIEAGVNMISKPTFYTHKSFLRSRFHTYGVDWSKKYITWTFNGRKIRRDKNKYWHQAFPMKFDVETMPHWFGLPSRKTLPALYRIKYIRAWERTRRRKRSVEAVRSAGRQALGLSSGNFGLGNLGIGSGFPLTKDGDTGVEEDEEDEAPLEVHSEDEEETVAPVDGLQRPPIPGSNERVYEPVVPMTGGRLWTESIVKVNDLLSDVSGSLLESGEVFDMSDIGDLNELSGGVLP